MTISMELIIFLGVCMISLIGLIYRNLDTKVTALTLAVDIVRANATDKETCALRIQLNEEKFLNLHSRMAEVSQQNKEYHDILTGSLKELHKSVDSIRDCVTKLSAGIDCD